jgi:hypothetical protein
VSLLFFILSIHCLLVIHSVYWLLLITINCN